MSLDSGGLSKEEFLILQQQLIQLRNRNYELQEELKRKEAVINSPSSKNEALQFASKLINRGKEKDKEKENQKKHDAEIDGMRRKLATQEEEFRLQQETLITELNKVVTQSEECKKRLEVFESQQSMYASPEAGTPIGMPPETIESRNDVESFLSQNTKLKSENQHLVEEKELLVLQIQEMKDQHTSLIKDKEASEEKVKEHQLFLSALETQVVDYKQKLEKLQSALSDANDLQEKYQQRTSDKDAAIIKYEEEIRQLNEMIVEMTADKKELQKESENIKNQLLASTAALEEMKKKVEESEKTKDNLRNAVDELDTKVHTMSEELAAVQFDLNKKSQELEESRQKAIVMENALKKTEDALLTSRDKFDKRMKELEDKHIHEKDEQKRLYNVEKNEMEKRLNELEEKDNRHLEDRLLLLETRYQLEFEDNKKAHEKEKQDLQHCIDKLNEKLAAKDDEKNLALKKQSALVKELQRTLREEKKRAEGLEKSKEEKGWHVVADIDAASHHTLDGNESVSSVSALESDNVELVNRVTNLQRAQADANDKLSFLERENESMRKEVAEKNELIAQWIRSRPSGPTGIGNTPQKSEGTLRKFLTATLTGDDAVNDMKEMNRKLQRMLEETLSKNILLQRDIQTLLERAGM